VWEKLKWIEIRGLPDYLDKPSEVGTLPDGRSIVFYPPRDRELYRREIQKVYKDAFDRSGLVGKRKVLQSYSSNSPNLAFDSESAGAWLWPLWQEWRARYGKADRKFLSAVARGIQSRGWGWMSKKRAQARLLAQAKRALSSLKAMSPLRELYRKYREGARSTDTEERRVYDQRYLKPLIALVKRETGYQTSKFELDRLKLSGVLSLAIGKRFKLRERDLH
jgi:hypothetical protein